MLKVFSNKSKPNTLQANLDRFDNNILFGWALDTKNTDKKLRLEILIDDEVITTIVANEFRSDLKESFGGDGKYAFTCPLNQVFHGNKLGKVTLRDSETGVMIPVNHFSVKYDLPKLMNTQDQTNISSEKEALLELNKFTKVVDYYNLKKFEKAKQIAENILIKEEDIPDFVYEKLLSIYLSEENYISATELYYSVKKNIQKKALFITFNEEMLNHCSSLWASTTIPTDLTPSDIHKLEILMIVLENTETITSQINIEKIDDIEILYLYFLKSGIFLSDKNINQLLDLLVDTAIVNLDIEEKTKLYISTLPFAKYLHTVIHTVDLNAVSKIHHYFEKVLVAERESEYAKMLVNLYLTYVTVLINTSELSDKNTVNIVLYMVHKLSKKYKIKNTQFYSTLMNLYYILGDYRKSLEVFLEYGVENIEKLDWNCKYLSQIIWLYFKNNQYLLSEGEIKEFLYKKQKEGRSTFLENAILLADLHRWKESVDTTLMYIIVKDLIFGYFTEEREEVHLFVQKIVKDLSSGTLSIYYDQSASIQKYLTLDQHTIKTPLFLHNAELFEFQNLYTLSLLTNSEEMLHEIKIDSKYKGLLDSEKKVQSIIVKECLEKRQNIAVLAIVDEYYEVAFLSYYQNMLKYLDNQDCTIYLASPYYTYQIYREENELHTKKIENNSKDIIEEIREQKYDTYLILGQNSVIHHKSFEIVQISNIYYASLFGNSESFSINNKIFQELLYYHSCENLFEYLLDMKVALSDILQDRHISFKEEEQGIISYESLDTKAISCLTNYEYPLFELDDIEKSLQYLTMLYTDERVEEITNINIGDVSMILLKESKHKKEDTLACFLVQRNEYLRLEGFLQYYRERGVNTFYIIDNGSDDGVTLDFLLEQDDVELYSSIQAYSQSLYGVKWIELLIQAKRIGKWNLVVDADELLFLDEKYSTFTELCKELDEEGYDSIHTPFLDMYSKGPINDTVYSPGTEILNTCAYYDKHFYTSFNTHGGIMGECNTYQGGIRSRAFGLDSVVLNKLPLFKFYPKQKLREGLHWIDNATPAYGKAVLLHFKYIETFHQYVVSEIKRGQHWNGASEYRQYYHFLTANPTFSLYDPTLSVKFTSVKDFYDNLFEPFHLGEKS